MNTTIKTVLRIVLALILIVFGANKFIHFMPAPEFPEAAGNFWIALDNTGYMIPIIGAIEIIVGLLLILNKWVGFALIILAPIAVNMMLFHINLAPAAIGPAALVTILNAILIYAYWDKFKALFE